MFGAPGKYAQTLARSLGPRLTRFGESKTKTSAVHLPSLKRCAVNGDYTKVVGIFNFLILQ